MLDPAPPRRVDAERLAVAEAGDARALVHEPVRARRARAARLLDRRSRAPTAGSSRREWLDDLATSFAADLADADPLDPGVPAPSAPWADAVVPLLGLERRGAKLYLPGATAGRLDESEAVELESRARARRLRAGQGRRPRARRAPRARGPARPRRRRVGDRPRGVRPSARRARRECEQAGSITLARFRDLLGTSRRPAQLLLERFDADGLTRRVGDARVLRRRGYVLSSNASSSGRW